MKELAFIQVKLKAPKKQENSHFKYYYRSCEDILEAVKPLLRENLCTITLNDDVVLIGDRYYIKATATIRNSEGEVEQTTAFAREEEKKSNMDVSQISGAASSYARKYALCGLLAIDDGKDMDSLNVSDSYVESEEEKYYRLMAKQEVDAATTVETLLGIYRSYTNLQKNPLFKKMFTDKRKEIENK